jgi:hypothetical protein
VGEWLNTAFVKTQNLSMLRDAMVDLLKSADRELTDLYPRVPERSKYARDDASMR